MKIAITSQDRTHITEHAGHCRRFWIYDVTDKAISQKTLIDLPADQTFHDTQSTIPDGLQGVQVLIAGGMGRGLTQRLARHGIEGIVTAATEPDTAVAAYLAGAIAIQEPGAGCAHGDGPHPHH